ncbi:MAG: hydroxyethylthiazole kinase [Oscillospiraceae bacterium]|nr:hydroxyethylthiazole kinase [Oscillospiraceae bacterium]
MNTIYTTLISQVRERTPLIHHITNYVTVNDCANITLAIGASPIMADALEEVANIARIASAVVLNMGTLNERTILSMLAAGKAANEAGVPVVFDPVGVGASALRNEAAAQLTSEIKISVLRGNISEIRFLAGLPSETQGVDASNADLKNAGDTATIAKMLSTRLNCVTVITGAVDTISDSKEVVCLENGHPMLGRITGTGCMCSSLIGAFCGVSPDKPMEAAIAALLSMGIAGEIAFEKSGREGTGSFRVALHDAVSHMSAEILNERMKFL